MIEKGGNSFTLNFAGKPGVTCGYFSNEQGVVVGPQIQISAELLHQLVSETLPHIDGDCNRYGGVSLKFRATDEAVAECAMQLNRLIQEVLFSGAMHWGAIPEKLRAHLMRLDRRLDKENEVMTKLDTLTYAVQHSPNCNKEFLIRLVGRHAGTLDYKEGTTKDICGFGHTLEEAAADTLAKREEAYHKT